MRAPRETESWRDALRLKVPLESQPNLMRCSRGLGLTEPASSLHLGEDGSSTAGFCPCWETACSQVVRISHPPTMTKSPRVTMYSARTCPVWLHSNCSSREPSSVWSHLYSWTLLLMPAISFPCMARGS